MRLYFSFLLIFIGISLPINSGAKEQSLPKITPSKILEEGVTQVVLSSDQKHLFVANKKHEILILDALTGTLEKKILYGSNVVAMEVSNDGKILFVGAEDGKARAIEITTGKVLAEVQHTQYVTYLAITPDGKYMFSGAVARTDVVMTEVSSGKTIQKIRTPHIDKIIVSADGKYLVIDTSFERELLIFDIAKQEIVRAIRKGNSTKTMRLSDDPSKLYLHQTDTGGFRILCIDIETGRINELPYLRGVDNFWISKNGKYLFAGVNEQPRVDSLQVYNLFSDDLLFKVPHYGYFESLAESDDGRYIFTGTWGDDKLRIIDLVTGQVVSEIQHNDGINLLITNQAGNRLYSLVGWELHFYELNLP
ncbi:MAG: WD40 repeat domain-containing protein [Pseudobdellovibrionaceae bacterium]